MSVNANFEKSGQHTGIDEDKPHVRLQQRHGAKCTGNVQANKTGEFPMARMDMSLVDNAQIAAGSNNASSLLELGIMYSTGRDVEQDLVSAHKCFNLAALQGLQEAR